jgi:RNA polymerase sigma-70 factor (ECF subfamily)
VSLEAEAELHRDLVVRVSDGDSAAENELVHLFAPRISMMCKVRIADREMVRDLVQEVLIATICALRKNQIKDPEKLPAFVAGVGRNVISNYLRKEAQRPIHEALPADLERAVVDSESHEGYEEKMVNRAMQALNEDDRQLVHMILIDGLRPSEIAARLGVSAEVVRTRKVRAIRRLSELVRKMSQS